jgi:hypothetical protein
MASRRAAPKHRISHSSRFTDEPQKPDIRRFSLLLRAKAKSEKKLLQINLMPVRAKSQNGTEILRNSLRRQRAKSKNTPETFREDFPKAFYPHGKLLG